MQSHNLNADSDVIERDIEEDNVDKFYTNSDRRVDGEAINHEHVNRYEALAVDAHQPSKKPSVRIFRKCIKNLPAP